MSQSTLATHGTDRDQADFDAQVRANQQSLTTDLQTSYDFIVCGSGSSGSVVARRLAENPDVSVLLLEAGGSDDVPSVMEPGLWPSNLGTEREWGFRSQPDPRLNGRSVHLAMGKVLGGGSSINVMVWARGHKNDWDYYAAEADDPDWNYESVLAIYRRIEDWQGSPDPLRRGRGGLVYVQPAPDPNPLASAMVAAAETAGIRTFPDHNGAMMESDGGAAISNVRLREGRRLSVFRTYAYPYMDQPNLTVLTGALVTRVTIVRNHATGVEILLNGRLLQIAARREVVLSLGAINTPKVLMQSGIGDAEELRRLGIDVAQNLPGVGANFQDHVMIAGCVREYPDPIAPRNNGSEATFFWKSNPDLDTPDIQTCLLEVPYASPEVASRCALPASSWSLLPGLVRPKSHGSIRLTGPGPKDPIKIDAAYLADPADLKAATASVEICREIGNSAAMRPFVKREVLPGGLKGTARDAFVRDAAATYFHQSCTAKMGRDRMAVVNGQLQVYGIDNLRVADASIMPRVATGNTMAPCVIIGERAADILRAKHRL